MRRELSGRVDDTVAASTAFASFLAWPGLVPDVGETVGNSPDGLESAGEVSMPSGNVGTDVPGSESPAFDDVELDVDDEVEATTSIVASAWKDVALLARAVAVRMIFSPADADLPTEAPATSSSL
jgi:hypothetical protein